MSENILETEWSYFVDVRDLETGVNGFSLSPNEAARGRLTQRLGILELLELDADIEVMNPESSHTIHVNGRIKARVKQECVVTLEPVENEIVEEFDAWFADPEQAIPLAKARRDRQTDKGNQEVQMVDEHEDPEPIVHHKIDLGELVTQHLCLLVDPYPHAEGVMFEVGDDTQTDFSGSAANPFAALKDWKDKLEQ